MALILNIDTALQKASVAIADNGLALLTLSNESRKDHAAWIHTAIENLFSKTGKQFSSLDAVAVSNGPGSYTGLRIGLSTAKGLCYALRCPLITISTTELLASAVSNRASDLIIPLIDARRNEVFTAVYDRFMREKNSPYSLILQPDSFSNFLAAHEVLFCGDGVEKARHFISDPNAKFEAYIADAGDLSAISASRYAENGFADLAYAEPFYVKEFHSPAGR